MRFSHSINDMKLRNKYGVPYSFRQRIYDPMFYVALVALVLIPAVLLSTDWNQNGTSYFAALSALFATTSPVGPSAAFAFNLTTVITNASVIIVTVIAADLSEAGFSLILSGDLASATRPHARGLRINGTLDHITEYLQSVYGKSNGTSHVVCVGLDFSC